MHSAPPDSTDFRLSPAEVKREAKKTEEWFCEREVKNNIKSMFLTFDLRIIAGKQSLTFDSLYSVSEFVLKRVHILASIKKFTILKSHLEQTDSSVLLTLPIITYLSSSLFNFKTK